MRVLVHEHTRTQRRMRVPVPEHTRTPAKVRTEALARGGIAHSRVRRSAQPCRATAADNTTGLSCDGLRRIKCGETFQPVLALTL
jgi:hypothetical protein